MIQAAALMGEKKYGDARQLLEAVREANPNAPDVDFSLGSVALREGNLNRRRTFSGRPTPPVRAIRGC